ncbi:putative DNA-binding protein (UPF0251 family) [Youngiibacter multivorans]|jgi:predicted DNA-binding protein (UPF0251 family)|uniref:DNA-binding protein (UPF0251 family) n=2 Tax=Youngiibacter multivorans TaxID=937251 RepID=A0ABS4G078_9CLOT|nr:DUF134 domain-containing protein [Youngiibacter multivorans]MBP1917958.1 putative DNA-binding protein (UPF0251 family) [Youngiibacter multivorans]
MKWRKVCCLPDSQVFGPMGQRAMLLESVVMTVDEYETIRLIDLEGMMQEECAVKMNVARTTVQKIYNDARKKLADVIVNGKVMRIEGGEYRLYDETERLDDRGCCRKHRSEVHHPVK